MHKQGSTVFGSLLARWAQHNFFTYKNLALAAVLACLTRLSDKIGSMKLVLASQRRPFK
jgi:hypothetical protein